MTNVEFVTNLMTYSRHGALTQVFVLQAIEYYAKKVKLPDGRDYSNALINWDSWKAIADEILEKINEKYPTGDSVRPESDSEVRT